MVLRAGPDPALLQTVPAKRGAVTWPSAVLARAWQRRGVNTGSQLVSPPWMPRVSTREAVTANASESHLHGRFCLADGSIVRTGKKAHATTPTTAQMPAQGGVAVDRPLLPGERGQDTQA